MEGGAGIVGVSLNAPLVPGLGLAGSSLFGVSGQALRLAELGDVVVSTWSGLGLSLAGSFSTKSKRCPSRYGGDGKGFGFGAGNSSLFRRLRSRSYAVPVRPSFSHCSCIMRLACVGSICWSGGRRGSGLYMLAIHGASPSGACLWLVDGRF